MDPLTLLLYVGTLWRDAEPGSDTDHPIPEPCCIPDQEVSFDSTPDDADFPWLDMYADVWDTQEEQK